MLGDGVSTKPFSAVKPRWRPYIGKNMGHVFRLPGCCIGFFLALAQLWGASSLNAQKIDHPFDVGVRIQSGELRQLADLIQDTKPEYARLTFEDSIRDRLNPYKPGWDSWYSGKRFYMHYREPGQKRGYLYLDGHCSWVVRNLETLEDISISGMDQLNYGTKPTMYNGDFIMIGGYGFFRFHRNWFKWDPRGGFAIEHFWNDQRDSLGYRPPNVLHAVWRDDANKSFLALGNARILDEPTGPLPANFEAREEFNSKKLSEFQLWKYPDNPKGKKGELVHYRDIHSEVFRGMSPIGSVETSSWVIFILDDTYSTPAIHKKTLEWYGLTADNSLPFGDKKELYGWMVNGDSLSVVSEGTIISKIDVTAHMEDFRKAHPEAFSAESAFLRDPVQPFAGLPLYVLYLIGAGMLALGGVIAYQQRNKQRVEVKLNKISTQVEILELFSRRIYHSVHAPDILWSIAEQCVESLGFAESSVYTKTEDGQSWSRESVAQIQSLQMREGHVPDILPIDLGPVGLAGQRGLVHAEKPQNPQTMFGSKILKRSVLAVPIVCDGSVIGVIEGAFERIHEFEAGHKKILQNVANLVGQKLGRSLSERKTLEFARFYEDNPSPVMRVAKDGLVLLTNDSAKAHFGSIAMVGETLDWSKLVHAANESLVEKQTATLSESHRTRIYQVKLVPNPEFNFVNIYAYEVTELERAKSRAEKAERAKADFLSVMSHEIRTPLNAIMGLNEIMLQEEVNDDQKQKLKYVQYSGKHLLSLVNDILSLEQLNKGEGLLETHPFDLRKLLQSLMLDFESRASDRGNKMRIEWSEGVPTVVEGNRHWITQMVNNLLDNAIKFTSRGEVILRIRKGISPEMILIDVEDTGIGVAEEHLTRITDPFEQVLTGPKNTGEKGTGLGLAITKRLATLHGGKLELQSALGVGSTFTLALVLPEADASQSSSRKGERKAPAPGTSGKDVPSDALLVLIADDNPLNLLVAQKLVERLGHTVQTAVHGEDAVAKWKEDRPDVILMDLQMPVMDGFEATKVIRTMCETRGIAHQRIVALTADAEPGTRVSALEAGMDEVLVKPADAIALHRAIHAMSPH